MDIFDIDDVTTGGLVNVFFTCTVEGSGASIQTGLLLAEKYAQDSKKDRVYPVLREILDNTHYSDPMQDLETGKKTLTTSCRKAIYVKNIEKTEKQMLSVINYLENLSTDCNIEYAIAALKSIDFFKG